MVPREIVTDKMGATPRGIEHAFIREGSPKHTVLLLELLHHTLTNGLKGYITQFVTEQNSRGWKSDNTPLREGQRLYYNFIRGHQSLNGLTPAEMAGLKVANEKNKWLDLLKEALARN